MKINLKDGEEIKVGAENGTPAAYRVLVCHQNCILLKGEFNAIKSLPPKLSRQDVAKIMNALQDKIEKASPKELKEALEYMDSLEPNSAK